MAKVNPFATAQKQARSVREDSPSGSGIQAALRVPSRSSTSRSRPHGRRVGQGVQGFRVQYNDAKACKAGIRFQSRRDHRHRAPLAAWMTWKCSLLGPAAGRRKGRRDLQPQGDVPGRVGEALRGYIGQVGRIIGPEKDVPARMSTPTADDGLDDGWYSRSRGSPIRRHHRETLSVGGSAGRGDAPRAGPVPVREAANELGIDLPSHDRRPGYVHAVLRCLPRQIAVRIEVTPSAYSKGCILCDEGLGREAVGSIRQRPLGLQFKGPKRSTRRSSSSTWTSCPVSPENVITERTPADRAKIVAELANGPTTPEADEILHKNGVT